MVAPLAEIGLFALAVALAFVGQKAARLFVIPGLLLAGALLGPGGTGAMQDELFLNNANNVGLVLLLFFTSLFAHPKAFRMGGRLALPLAAYDLVLNFAAAYWIGALFGWELESRLFLAGVMATSSTGTILKILSDEGRLLRREGNVLISLLWIEDIAFIAYYIFLSRKDVAHEFLSLTTLVGALGYLSFLLVLRLVRDAIWRIQRREVLVSLVTGLGLLGTWLGSLAGLPYVGSAFTCGLVLAGAGGARFIQTEAPYLREIAASVFFFSFGAMLDPHATMQIVPLALAALGGIIVTELLFLPAVARLLGLTGAESFIVGASLVSRGGKSAAFAKLGTESRADPTVVAQIHSVSGILTVILTPLAPLLVRFMVWWRRNDHRYRPDSREVLSSLTRRVLAPAEFAQRHLVGVWRRVVLGEWMVLVFSLGLFSTLVSGPLRWGALLLGFTALVPAYREARRYFGLNPTNPTMTVQGRRRALPPLEDFLPPLLLGPCLLALVFPLLAPIAVWAYPVAATVMLAALLLLPRVLHPVARAPRLGRVLPG